MFCIVKGSEALGHCKVIDQTGTNCIVEYFCSPVEAKRDVRTVPITQIKRRNLGANTRIYYRAEAGGVWLVGRVLQDDGDGVEVRFSDKNDIFLPYENLFVRCKRPIEDPTDYLANVITETPQYAEARSLFLASYIRQRGAAWGISALLSSSIELEAHQISVVRRILNDPSQRYLLADEVGLGKTIEAGVVIRQAVLDDPRNHRVVVLVPGVLVRQWREELTNRFGLIDFVDDSVVVISQDESLSEIDSQLTQATMLVVDEAHHIATATGERLSHLYDSICAHAKNIDRLLLLSATPVLRNEVGFLRMLHLLDSAMYPLGHEESFREKIRHRQVLAESVAMLDPQNALFLGGVLGELQCKLSDDERLHELIAHLRSVLDGIPDEDDPRLVDSIRLLRAHLSETYRLNRRILRNRRKRVKFVTPDRCGGEQSVVLETNLAHVESLIEAWRISASADSINSHPDQVVADRIQFYWSLLAALLANPGDVCDLCSKYLIQLTRKPLASFDGEKDLLKELISVVDQEGWMASRLDQIATLVAKSLTGRTKIVIFCSLTTVADAVYERLRTLLKGSVARHSVPNEEDEDEVAPAWLQFNTNEAVRVIVCDRRAEEGINLQGGSKLVIHFDLPIEPNRIEQRMGRVDRYGAGDSVKSVVLIDDGSKYQQHWYGLLDSVLGVFDQSISSLQYLVEFELKSLTESVFGEGIDALVAMSSRLGGANGAVSKELKLIDQQDALDELMPLADDDLGDVFDVDSEWNGIRQATVYWANETLLFNQIPEANRPADNPTDPAFRFGYRAPGQGGQATLIALSGFLDDFMGALDYDHPRSTSRQPLSYAHCARRQTGVRGSYRLIRYGDEFVEALKSFSDMDDRGKSFAMWRQIRQDYVESEPRFYFCFDFLIETAIDGAASALKHADILSDTSLAAVTRRGDSLFTPFVERVWVNDEGDEPPTDFIKQYLDQPYDKRGATPSYMDTNLKSVRFRRLIDAAPDAFLNWKERCGRMRDRARATLVARPYLAASKMKALDRAKIEDELRQAQLTTRIRTLSGIEAEVELRQMQIEREINDGLYQGILSPLIKVDVSGVIMISSAPFPLN